MSVKKVVGSEIFRAKAHRDIVPRPKILRKMKAGRNKLKRPKLASKIVSCQFHGGLCSVCFALYQYTAIHDGDLICQQRHRVGQNYKIPIIAIQLARRPLPVMY